MLKPDNRRLWDVAAPPVARPSLVGSGSTMSATQFESVLSHASGPEIQVQGVFRLDPTGGRLPFPMVAGCNCVSSVIRLNFPDGASAGTYDRGIGAGDHSRIQEPAMLCAIQRSPFNFGSTHDEQFDPGQQADLDGRRPGFTEAGPRLKVLFYRHFAWLTALRFSLRERKTWENTFERGNAQFLAALPTPEYQSDVNDELKTCLSDIELQKLLAHPGDRESLILHWQYDAIRDLRRDGLISEFVLIVLTGALDDIFRLQVP